MLETSVRLLRLLSLLQTRRDWSGAELAERLGVTTRTVRNDIERLRILGYEVHSGTGIAGGYRLGAGVRDAAAAARRRGGGGRRAGAARRGGRHGHRDRGDLAARADQARADAAGPAAAAAGRAAQATVSAAGGGPTVDAETLTTSPPPAATTSSCASTTRARRRGRRAPGRAAPAGLHRSPLVPAGLGPRPRGLAHVPGRPGPAAAADRPTVHPAGAARGRGATRRPRCRLSGLALPGPGPPARPGRLVADRITPAGGLLTPVRRQPSLVGLAMHAPGRRRTSRNF